MIAYHHCRLFGASAVAVRSKNGKLFLDFRWRDIRCREFTEYEDTVDNRKKCAAVLDIIRGEMRLGTLINC